MYLERIVLLQILDFIQREKIVSIQQLSREFSMDDLALQPLLNIWIRKEKIRPYNEIKGCKSSCMQCNTKNVQYYQLI